MLLTCVTGSHESIMCTGHWRFAENKSQKVRTINHKIRNATCNNQMKCKRRTHSIPRMNRLLSLVLRRRRHHHYHRLAYSSHTMTTAQATKRKITHPPRLLLFLYLLPHLLLLTIFKTFPIHPPTFLSTNKSHFTRRC